MVCDEFEVAGCTDATARNYNADATDSDDCEYAEDGYDCDGNCLADADGDGLCDEFEVAGCTDATARNYDADATDNDGFVTSPIPATTATATASAIPTATASATNLKSQDVSILLYNWLIRSLLTTMLRASSPSASTPKRVIHRVA